MQRSVNRMLQGASSPVGRTQPTRVATRHAVMQILQHVPTHFDAERCNASLFDTLSESCNVSKSTKVVWLGSGQNDLGRNAFAASLRDDFEAKIPRLRDQDSHRRTRFFKSDPMDLLWAAKSSIGC
jgi:hypothetical protein